MSFFILLVLVLLAVSVPCPAASDDHIRFSQLSIDEGLSQSIVSCITQDHQGFMWFGTEDGLNRFDGYDVKILRHIPSNPNSLSYNEILCLMEDSLGFLWVGTFNGGLDRYNPATRQFKHFRNEPGVETSLSHDIVRVVFEDRAGNIWAGTDSGLNVLDRASGKFKRYKSGAADGSLTSGAILSILEDNKGTLWVGTNGGGLNFLEPNATGFDHYGETLDSGSCLGHQVIRSLYEDKTGALWVGTDGGGLVEISPDRLSHFCYLHDPDDPSSLSNNRVYSIFEDNNNAIWAGTDGGGLSRMNRATGKFVSYVNDPHDNSSLAFNQIRAIFEDRSGVIWVGTYGGGVNRFDGKRKAFQLYKSYPLNPNSLSHDIIWSISENAQGDLWIGTHGSGLDHLNRSTGRYSNFRHDESNPNSLSHDVVRVVLEDGRGLLWLGTNGGGVCTMDPSTGIFQFFRHDSQDPGSLSHDQIRSIFEDSDGIIWIGTNGGGLNRLDPTTGLITRYQHDPSNPTSLSNDFVRVIFEDSRGMFWLGTQGGGLERLDRETGEFSHIIHISGDNNSLGNNFIFSIFEDQDKVLWLGTWGGGLNRFDVAKNSFTCLTTEDGLASNAIYGVLQDEDGRLWMSTNNGLSRYNPATGTFKSFNVEDGLQSNEFNGGSFFRGSDGEMFFGGIQGFNSFFPAMIKDNPVPPPIAITSFLKMNKEYKFDRPIDALDEISLSYKDLVFSFEFAALDFSAPGKNQYAYMMEGLHKNWIPTGPDKRSATFTTLAPGHYRFRVIGSNNDGVWNRDGQSVTLVITPPFTQTWWFRLLLVFIFAGLAALLYRWRINNARISSELQTARRAQMGILPHTDPTIAQLDISATCIPAYEVGGDFYDIFWQDREETHLGVAVGDVSGKAMKAAMVAVLSSGMVYCGADKCRLPSALFKQLNRSLFAKTEETMFTALSFLSIDINSRDITFAMAAMEPPVVISDGKALSVPDAFLGLPLGAFDHVEFQDNHLRLESGQVMVLYTDGVVEARNKAEDFYDAHRLLALLEKISVRECSAVEIKEQIVDDVRQFTGGTLQHDDMTLVVIKSR